MSDVQNNYRKHKAALTRATNSGDPNKIIAACDAAFADFDTYEHGWPDDWHRWNIAKQDAELKLAYGL